MTLLVQYPEGSYIDWERTEQAPDGITVIHVPNDSSGIGNLFYVPDDWIRRVENDWDLQ
jgi:hypothetical protein